MKTNWPTGLQVIKIVAQKTDTITLNISRGKESMAMWLACKPHFKKIVPVHLN